MKNNNIYFDAAVLTKLNDKLKILKLYLPKELSKGQVLVKLISSGICGAQANEIAGIKGPDKYIPHMMGHEGFGMVIKTGPGVRKVKKGNKVIMHWRKGYGLEAEGAKYFSKEIGNINSGKVTTFSEFSIVSENRVTKIQLDKKYEKLAPLFGCSISTAYGLIFNEAKIKKSNIILISGCGGLGLAIAAMARSVGVKEIYFIDKSFNNFKLKFIKNLDLKEKNLLGLKDIFNNKNKFKFDQVIDTTGNTEIISAGFDVLKKNASLILVGQPKVNKILKINNPLKFFDGIKIYASDGGNVNPSRDLKKISRHVMKNFKYFKNFISHTVSLKNINLGFQLLKNGKTLRVGIKF